MVIQLNQQDPPSVAPFADELKGEGMLMLLIHISRPSTFSGVDYNTCGLPVTAGKNAEAARINYRKDQRFVAWQPENVTSTPKGLPP